MVGARAMGRAAGGSRPKIETVRTRGGKTTAGTKGVRERNSSTKSLRATVHACRSRSAIHPPSSPSSPSLFRHRPTVLLGDLGGAAAAARRELNEPAAPLERHYAGELDALVHVVGREHDAAARTAQLSQQRAQRRRRLEVEPGERLVEQQP